MALEVPVSVLEKVSVAGLRVTAGFTPVPLRPTVCGVPVALSATLTVAVNVPVVAGLKVTVMVQLALAATLLPHVLVWLKELGSVPLMLMATLSSGPVPVFLSVMAFVALEVPVSVLEKASELGLSVAAGATPFPLKLTDCGDPVALSAMLTDAVSVPVACGLKVTVMVQLEAAATLLPQLLVWLKELGSVPLMLIATLLSDPVPVFLRVIVWVALDVPVSVLEKVSELGLSDTAGAVPVPVKPAVCGEGVALSATLTEAISVPVAFGLKVT